MVDSSKIGSKSVQIGTRLANQDRYTSVLEPTKSTYRAFQFLQPSLVTASCCLLCWLRSRLKSGVRMINCLTNTVWILRFRVLFRRLLTSIMPIALLGCSSMSMNSGTALAQADNGTAGSTSGAADRDSVQSPIVPEAQMDSQLMFELMIAELAGRRGQLDVALAGYLRASQRTNDPRVSERAARLAMFGRQWADAENAVRRWVLLDASAEGADAILAQALLGQGKINEAADLYVSIVSSSDDRVQAIRQVQLELQQ